MQKLNWDDLRYVLAVADSGSVASAARILGVNHATVLRRLNAFEAAAGAPVFERSAQGYRLRADRLAVIEAARDAASALDRAGRHLSETLPDGGSLMRLTSVDSLCQSVLAEEMPQIAKRIAPHRLALISANTRLDISRLQAEMTVRPTPTLEEFMVGEIACDLAFAVYANKDAPGGWLGLGGTLAGSLPGRWLADHVLSEHVVALADSFQVLTVMAQAGMGRAVLPCILGDRARGLNRIDCDMPDLRVPLWVATHRDLAGLPRIDLLQRAVFAALRRQRDALEGVAKGA